MGTDADRLAQLLSTDWFLPYWNHIDVLPNPQLQKAMRGVCLDLIGDAAEYYDVSFAPDRRARTTKLFEAALDASSVPADDLVRLRHLAGLVRETPAGDFMPLHTLLWIIALDPALRRPFGDEAFDMLVFTTDAHTGLVPICETSPTPWDRQTQSWRPEMPEYLGILADELIGIPQWALMFWSWLSGRPDLRPQAQQFCVSLAAETGFGELYLPRELQPTPPRRKTGKRPLKS